MKPFVMIFRQAPAALTDADKLRLAQEVAPWVQRQNTAGHNLESRILTPESAHLGSDNPTAFPPGAVRVGAFLFLEARDLNEAVAVAESHPFRRAGVDIEVRAWFTPVPAPSTSNAPIGK